MEHSKDFAKGLSIGIIMDGNGRWAKSRLRPRTEGHRQGVEALNRVVEAAARAGIERLTVFAFSSENWRRPAAEVSMLMKLFAQALRRWCEPLVEAGADTPGFGCTDHPFLSDAIRLTAGPGIRLIDPAPAVARQLKRRLDEPGLLNDTKKAPARIFCTTDANEARERILRLLWTDNAVLQKLDGSVRP